MKNRSEQSLNSFSLEKGDEHLVGLIFIGFLSLIISQIVLQEGLIFESK